jgi:hypothetical protein
MYPCIRCVAEKDEVMNYTKLWKIIIYVNEDMPLWAENITHDLS